MKREERREKRGAGQRERERVGRVVGGALCLALLLFIQLSFVLLCVFHHR